MQNCTIFSICNQQIISLLSEEKYQRLYYKFISVKFSRTRAVPCGMLFYGKFSYLRSKVIVMHEVGRLIGTS